MEARKAEPVQPRQGPVDPYALSMEERMALYRKKYGQPRQERRPQGEQSRRRRPYEAPRPEAAQPEDPRSQVPAPSPEIREAEEKPRGILGKLQGLFGAKKTEE